ncbi:MAG: hypothetical protein QXI36_03580 [Candidatus Bathyarchaeia archaeon]
MAKAKLKREVILALREYFLWLSILSILPSMMSPTTADPSYYYAGYAFKNKEWLAPWGTTAEIYAVNTNVPAGHLYAEWITIILSYYYKYWIQLGYLKTYTYTEPWFYWETYDSSGQHRTYVIGSTIPGHTYTFIIVHATKTDLRLWDLVIREGANTIWSGEVSVNPYEPKDHRAFVETTTTAICITGSHFSELRYFDGRSWPYWYTHVKIADLPYYVVEVSHHEFYANGGG